VTASFQQHGSTERISENPDPDLSLNTLVAILSALDEDTRREVARYAAQLLAEQRGDND
jgi:hypothetical protein